MGIHCFSYNNTFNPSFWERGNPPLLLSLTRSDWTSVCTPCLLCGLPNSPGCNLPMLLQVYRLPIGWVFLPPGLRTAIAPTTVSPFFLPICMNGSSCHVGPAKHWTSHNAVPFWHICIMDYTIFRLFWPIRLQYLREITGQRSLPGRNQFELYKTGLGMASSIKSQPDPHDLKDFALTKAEKVHHFGSVDNVKICSRSE